ncbi:helix-turn-helix transcriptional regulator [Streptomyces zhihengii]
MTVFSVDLDRPAEWIAGVQLGFMTTAELAALLRKSPAAVRQMRHRGQAPRGTRVGRDVLYAVADVEAWLAAKTAADPLAQRALDAYGPWPSTGATSQVAGRDHPRDRGRESP